MNNDLVIFVNYIFSMKNLNIISELLCYPIENKFISLYHNLTIKEDTDKFPDIIFYFDNSICFGEYNKKTNRFFYVWYRTWKRIDLKYFSDDVPITFILDFLIRKYFNLDICASTLCPYSNYDHYYIEHHFKCQLSD